MASGPAGEAPAPDPSVAATFCATLVDEWVRAGVTDVVVAPGSRSTPITMAVANGGGLTVHVHHDERSAGFMALGLALSSGRPAVVVTTSGTAAVELHPAVVEAHQAAVPMIVVTADRPPELHSVGAPQTVEQVGLFGTSVRWACAPGVPDAAAAGSWRSIGARSVAEATDSVAGPGPVHLDLAFRDPLTGRAGPLPPGRPDGRSWHTTGGGRLALSRQGVARLTELLDADRGVIVAGAGAGDPALVLELAGATGWPVLADPPSGCRRLDERVVGAFDALLRHDGFAARQQPEVVLRLGRAPASKVLGTWLAASGARQVVVTADGRWIDPDRTAAHVLHADPTAVCTALARTVTRPHNRAWLESWASAEAAAQAALDDVLGAHPEPTEPGIARTLLATAP
ncbi:MAG: hypothetical protein JWM05_3298, partial [Acidimicrobiales bacterium]|nr:hypothetical protein [Acidimicrobiales bacterium]